MFIFRTRLVKTAGEWEDEGEETWRGDGVEVEAVKEEEVVEEEVEEEEVDGVLTMTAFIQLAIVWMLIHCDGKPKWI